MMVQSQIFDKVQIRSVSVQWYSLPRNSCLTLWFNIFSLCIFGVSIRWGNVFCANKDPQRPIHRVQWCQGWNWSHIYWGTRWDKHWWKFHGQKNTLSRWLRIMVGPADSILFLCDWKEKNENYKSSLWLEPWERELSAIHCRTKHMNRLIFHATDNCFAQLFPFFVWKGAFLAYLT